MFVVRLCLLACCVQLASGLWSARATLSRISMSASNGDNNLQPQQQQLNRRRHRAVLTSNRIRSQLVQIQQQQAALQQQQEELQELQELTARLAGETTATVPALPTIGGSSSGGGGGDSSGQSPGGTAAGEQELFRHRFLVSSDLCIRLPIEAATLLRAFVVHSHLSGVINLQLESFRPVSKVTLCPDAKRMASMPNAGGSSLLSEVLAFELLARAFGASLERTELELDYAHGSTMTDFAITIFGGYPLGVSVTRAYKWRGGLADPSGLNVAEARRLIIKKLAAINVSSRNVQNYRWRKQLLHVWAFTHRDAVLLEKTYSAVPASLRANTVLLITRCNGVNWIR